MSNVKAGDLAVIVGAKPAGEFLIGRFCEVLHAECDGWWWIRLQRILNPLTGLRGCEGLARDQYLRPIRDPGPDAVDESLFWLPVDHETWAAAHGVSV